MGRTVDRILQNVDLLEYMRDCGYTPYPIGSCYGLKEHSSVRIFPETNTYFHPGRGENRRLNVINFAAWYHNIDNQSAIKLLAEELNDKPGYMRPKSAVRQEQKPPVEKKKDFALPQRTKNSYRKAYAYLNQKRCIDKSVLKDMINRGFLFEDERGNASFVGFNEDGKENFCFQRGCGDKPYKHIVAGSDFSTAWHIDNGADKLFVNEAIIDSMSVMTMFQMHGYDPNMYNYVATCGPSMKPLLNFIQKHPDTKTVYLGFDKDEAGRRYTAKATEALRSSGYTGKIIDKPPKTKDFNQDLQTITQSKGRVELSHNQQSQTNNLSIERNITR